MFSDEIKNEYDVIKEIYLTITHTQDELKRIFEQPRVSKDDREYLEILYKSSTNNILALAYCDLKYDFFSEENFKNKVLPRHHLKPNKEFLEGMLKYKEEMNQAFDRLEKLMNEYMKQKGAKNDRSH